MENEDEARDSGILSNPLSLIRSGYFYCFGASPYSRNSGGDYWYSRSANTIRSNYLGFYDTGLYLQVGDNRGDGYAVRCVATLQILHHSY